MRIEKMSGCDRRYCENCGRIKTNKKTTSEHLTNAVWKIYTKSGTEYMLCQNCLHKLFDCVENINICEVHNNGTTM